MKIFFIILMTLSLIGCADSRSRVFREMETKQVYLNIANDTDLISPELTIGLTELGFKVDSSISEARKYQAVKNGNVITTSSISGSNKRYEVILSYNILQSRFVAYNIIVRDRDDDSLVATCKYRWDRLFPAPSIDSGVEDIVKFINKLTIHP
jgi:hypothetical protein